MAHMTTVVCRSMTAHISERKAGPHTIKSMTQFLTPRMRTKSFKRATSAPGTQCARPMDQIHMAFATFRLYCQRWGIFLNHVNAHAEYQEARSEYLDHCLTWISFASPYGWRRADLTSRPYAGRM